MEVKINGFIFCEDIDICSSHPCENCIKNKNCEIQENNKGEIQISDCNFLYKREIKRLLNRELLSKVLQDKEIGEWDYEIEIEDNFVKFCGGHRNISICDLSYKCKEWAFGLGFSYLYEKNTIFIKNLYNGSIEKCIENLKIKRYFDIEVDLNACSWIIDYVNKKNNAKDNGVVHKAGYTICHDTECDVIYNLLMYAYNKKIYKKDFIRVSSVLFLVKDEKKEIYKFLKDYNC